MLRQRNWIAWDPPDDGGGGGAGDGAAAGGGAPAAGAPPAPGGGHPQGGGDGGERDAEYISQVSPELRKNADLRKFLSARPKMNDLVIKAFEDSRRLGRAVVIPSSEKPDPAEVKSFMAAMGIPGKADEYEIKTDAFKKVEGLEGAVAFVRGQAWEMKLSKIQAQKLFETYMKINQAAGEKASQERKIFEDSFESRVLELAGKDETRKTELLNLYKRGLVKRFGKEQLLKKLADKGLLHDTDFVSQVAEIERNFGEEPFIEGSPQGGGRPRKEPGELTHHPEFDRRYGATRRRK